MVDRLQKFIDSRAERREVSRVMSSLVEIGDPWVRRRVVARSFGELATLTGMMPHLPVVELGGTYKGLAATFTADAKLLEGHGFVDVLDVQTNDRRHRAVVLFGSQGCELAYVADTTRTGEPRAIINNLEQFGLEVNSVAVEVTSSTLA